MAGGESDCLPLLNPLYSQIAESVPGKVGPQHSVPTSKNILVCGFSKTQIFGIKVAVLIQRFTERRGELAALRVNVEGGAAK